MPKFCLSALLEAVILSAIACFRQLCNDGSDKIVSFGTVSMLNTVTGKAFVHPATKVEYGRIRIPPTPTTFSTLDGTSYNALAEDDCGNYFTTTHDGAVWFWDHETDELIRLADSVSEFISHCTDPQPVELDPKQVKRVWIDPKFAKSLGMKVPEDGWVKKPPKGK